MSDHPPSRWLRVALLLMLLSPAVWDGREQERITRSDSIPDLIAARVPLARVRTEPCCTDVPHVTVVPRLELGLGCATLLVSAAQPGRACGGSGARNFPGPRGPPAA